MDEKPPSIKVPVVRIIFITLFISAGLASISDGKSRQPVVARSLDMLDFARKNNLDMVKSKLHAGAKIDAVDADGNTALHIAAAGGFQKLAKYLVEHKADVNARNQFGQTPLHAVTSADIARILVEKGADVNVKDAEFGMTPVFFHKVETAKIIVDAGADINFKGKNGNTPLMWYAYNGYWDGIKFLLDNGADINVINEEGSTALDIALMFEDKELAIFLISRGAKTAEEMK